LATLLSKGAATAIAVCRYSAFQTAPNNNCNVMCRYSAFKRAYNGNCTVYYAFKGAPIATPMYKYLALKGA